MDEKAFELIRRIDALRAWDADGHTFQKKLRDIPAVEPCKDAVSREWLLTELEEMNVANFYELNEHSRGAYEDMKLMLRDAPPVTVEPKQAEWIPCEERLPEEHEWIGTKRFGTTISDEVHITFDVNGERFVRTLSLQNGELSNYDKQTMDEVHKGWKMVAWMPLPRPYMKGADDE